MLGKIFGNKEEENNKKIAEDMNALSDQIATLRQQLNEKNSTVESLNQQLADAQSGSSAGASNASNAAKQISDLRSQLAVAQADKEAQDYQLKELMAHVSDMQSKLAATQAAQAVVPASGANAPAATLGAEGLAVGSTAWVTRDGGMQLNVRSGPGLGNPVVAALDQGSSLTVLAGPHESDGYSWYQMRSERGVEGWVAGEFLRDHAV